MCVWRKLALSNPVILLLHTRNLHRMTAAEKRDQKGERIRVAPCLFRYRSSGTYYAVVRRSGKLIRRCAGIHGQAEASGLKYEHINLDEGTIKLFRVERRGRFRPAAFFDTNALVNSVGCHQMSVTPSNQIAY